MPSRNVGIAVRFSDAEVARVRAKAEDSGMSLRGYIREVALSATEGPSPESMSVLCSLAKTRELFVRLWTAGVNGGLDGRGVAEIVAGVEAVRAEVWAAREGRLKVNGSAPVSEARSGIFGTLGEVNKQTRFNREAKP